MKKILVGIAFAALALAPLGVSAKSKPIYCGTTPYDVAYSAVYNYPTGSYWQSQIAAYPAYYAKHNAQFKSEYGCQ